MTHTSSVHKRRLLALPMTALVQTDGSFLRPPNERPTRSTRAFTPWVTFWVFLAQVLSRAQTCREAVRQTQGWFRAPLTHQAPHPTRRFLPIPCRRHRATPPRTYRTPCTKTKAKELPTPQQIPATAQGNPTSKQIRKRLILVPFVAVPIYPDDLCEIPRREKFAGRPSLAQLFEGTDSASKARDQAIAVAHILHGYTMKEIADCLGVHYATISRAIQRQERENA